MTLLEMILPLLLTSQPFGPLPFTVAQVDSSHLQIELLSDPPQTLLINEELEVLQINGIEQTCSPEEEI